MILNKDSNSCVVKFSDSEHPVFKAHFPSNPILPGFLLVDILSHIFNLRIIKIKKAKFILGIYPNETITFQLEYRSCDLKVVIQREDKKVAEVMCEYR